MQFQFLGGEDTPWSRKQQPLFCLENPMDRGSGRLQSMELQSWTQLSKHIVYISHIYIYITSIYMYTHRTHTCLCHCTIASNQLLLWINTTPPGAGSLLTLRLIHCCFFNFLFYIQLQLIL